MDPDQLTLRLGLTRLEREGGWCRELGARRDGSSSSILYMMRTSDTTAWHRLTGINEFWCHHQGANIRWEICIFHSDILESVQTFLFPFWAQVSLRKVLKSL